MKCDFCGGDLSLEAECCPHCGQLNKHAQQHIRDMERYHGEFESTKKGVYSVTRQYTAVTVRAIIIAAMVVVIALLLFLYNEAYSIRRNILESHAARHEQEYSEILDRYLAEEDFLGFKEFISQKGINSYFEDHEYDQYMPMQNIVTYYLFTYESMMDLVCESDAEDRAETIKNICSYMNNFYEYCDLDRYYYYENADRQENLDAIATMKTNVKLMLQTYCHLTEEEIESWEDMTDAKRTVLIEERLGYGQ